MSKAFPMELPSVSDSWFDKDRRHWWGPWVFGKAATDPLVFHQRKIWSRSTVILLSHPLRFWALLNLFSLSARWETTLVRRRNSEAAMAAPEAPLCYVGIARQSSAFRLMKQMVLSFSKYVYSSCEFVGDFFWKNFGMRCCLIDSSWRDVGVGGRRRAWQGQARDQRLR